MDFFSLNKTGKNGFGCFPSRKKDKLTLFDFLYVDTFRVCWKKVAFRYMRFFLTEKIVFLAEKRFKKSVSLLSVTIDCQFVSKSVSQVLRRQLVSEQTKWTSHETPEQKFSVKMRCL